MNNSQLSSASIPSPSTQTQNIWVLKMQSERRSALKHPLQKAGITLKTAVSPLSSKTTWDNGRSLLWWDTAEDGLDLSQVIATLPKTSAHKTFPLFQFQDMTASQLAEMWGAVDDVVMGGVSASGFRHCHGYAQFSGQVSTQNSGGFVSVRTRNFDPPYNLGEWQGLRLSVRGEGQRYKLILRDRPSWDGAAYCGSFDTVKDEWQTVEVPFADLLATFRARTVPNASPLDSAQICAFQLMLSKFEYDGKLNPHFQPGTFALNIRDVSAYAPAALPPLVVISTSTTDAERYDSMLADSGLTYQVVVLDSRNDKNPGEHEDSAWVETLLKIMDGLNQGEHQLS
ncbi:MAG: CIA30 family protein [Leptolyngbyaceae cyanobacterium]